MDIVRLGEDLYITVLDAEGQCIRTPLNVQKEKPFVKNAEAETFIQKKDVEEFDEGTVGNIVPFKDEQNAKLVACKCPRCKAIFTLEFSNEYEYKQYKQFRDNCPVCNHCCDWLNYKIPIFWYKWLRWVRSHNKDEST